MQMVRHFFFLSGMQFILLGTLFAFGSSAWGVEKDPAFGRQMAQQATKSKALWITSDHTQHAILKQAFDSGPEVTKACLSCHNQAAVQFHQTIHWTWMDPNTSQDAKLGKGGLSINNF